MAESRKIVLEGNDLVKKYGEKYSLNHVNIQIYEGEFLSLLGPSGCGKTTLLKLLAGLDVPTAGVVLRDGKDVTNIPAYGRDSNMVFQNLALFPHMTVWNNVAYGLKVKHVSKPQIKERVERVLKLVQLEEYKDRMPSQLSGGQAQRVAIARALVNEPKVLFLDEPLSALDMKLRVAMQQELRKIQRESGATFVFVTHDQQEAIAISDRIAVLSQGKLQQIGTVPEIFEWSANQFVAEFIGDTNLIPVHLDGYNTDEGNVFTYLDKNTSFCSRYSKNLTTADTENLILSVKHQYVYITKNQTRATNTFRGIVKEANYGGTEYFYEVEVEQGFIMKAAVSIHLNMRQFKVGEQVWLSWEVEDGLLIKAGYDDEE